MEASYSVAETEASAQDSRQVPSRKPQGSSGDGQSGQDHSILRAEKMPKGAKKELNYSNSRLWNHFPLPKHNREQVAGSTWAPSCLSDSQVAITATIPPCEDRSSTTQSLGNLEFCFYIGISHPPHRDGDQSLTQCC